MQVVVTSREEDAVSTGWGQEGSLCSGDVPFLILLMCSISEKLLSLTLLICTVSCMYVVLNIYILKRFLEVFRVKSKFTGSPL